ncbi:MAG: hypothetical protein R3D29_16140 [Nitratireductor sp.]
MASYFPQCSLCRHPGSLQAVMINGGVHIDGGIANPVAFDLVEKLSRLVVAWMVGMPESDPFKLPSRIEAAFGASQLLMQSLIQMKLKLHFSDLFIRPAVNEFRVLVTSKTANP